MHNRDYKNSARKISKDRVLELLGRDKAKRHIEYTKQVGFPYLESNHLKDINRQLDILENYIDENKDGTDYMNGMIKAFEMIER